MPWVNPRKEGNPTIDSFQEASFRPRSLNFPGNFAVGLTKGAATVLLGRRSCAAYEHRAREKRKTRGNSSESRDEEQFDSA